MIFLMTIWMWNAITVATRAWTGILNRSKISNVFASQCESVYKTSLTRTTTYIP